MRMQKAQPTFAGSSKDEFRRLYPDASDIVVSSIRQQFFQNGFKLFSLIEQVLFKACSGDDCKDSAEAVCTFFDGIFNKECLLAQLVTMLQLSQEGTLHTIRAQETLVDEGVWFFKLLWVLPPTNATLEPSFQCSLKDKVLFAQHNGSGSTQ